MSSNRLLCGIRKGAAVVFALLAAATLAAAQQNRIVRPIDGSRRAVLPGNRNPRALPQNDEGPLEGSRRISGMTLALKASAEQTGELETLLEELQDPRSPNF